MKPSTRVPVTHCKGPAGSLTTLSEPINFPVAQIPKKTGYSVRTSKRTASGAGMVKAPPPAAHVIIITPML